MVVDWFVTCRLVKAIKAAMKEWDVEDCKRAFSGWAAQHKGTSTQLAMPEAPAGLLDTIINIFMWHLESITSHGIPVDIVFDGETPPEAKARAQKTRKE